MSDTVVSNIDPKLDATEISKIFFFKKNKDGFKRPDVKITVKVPTFAEIINYAAQNPIGKVWIKEAVNEAFLEAVQEQINDPDKPINAQEELNLDKLTLEAILRETPAATRARSITKEMWIAFAASYLAIMARIAPERKASSNENAVNLFTGGLRKLRGRQDAKDIANLCEGLINSWFAAIGEDEQDEDLLKIYNYLKGRIVAIKTESEENLMEAIA
jgi:hypothetical protein